MDHGRKRIYLFELEHQCNIALLAASDVDRALQALQQRDEVWDPMALKERQLRFWTSLQAFLSASAAVSRLLWPVERAKNPYAKTRGAELRELLSIPDTSILKSRAIRDNFEHIDERLDVLVYERGKEDLASRNIMDPALMGGFPLENHVALYNPSTRTVTFLGNTSDDIGGLVRAIQALHDQLQTMLNV